jgi:uncharacterized protein YbjT (DUF2867 family)
LNLLVLGSTGVVGDAIVRAALLDVRVSALIAVSRRPLAHAHPRLRTIILANFSDFDPLAAVLADVDVVLCALGVSWYQASGEARYRQITHDYVMACARTASVANPAARFCFVSGQGASVTSSQAWARIKAETERDLEATFASRLTVFRPGYVHPAYGRETPYWGDTVMRPLMPLRRFLGRYITDCDEVARAVLYAATGGGVPSPATNRDILEAARAYALDRLTASTQ